MIQGPPMFSQFAASSQQQSSSSANEGPLFDRFESDYHRDLLQARRNAKDLQRRVQELERINIDLEQRLEDEAKQNIEIEHECTEIERVWRLKCEVMENNVREWKAKCERQEKKAERLREQISRTERELYGILQRKYELMRGGGAGGGANPLMRRGSGAANSNLGTSLSGQDIMNRETGSGKEERKKVILKNLAEFMGLF